MASSDDEEVLFQTSRDLKDPLIPSFINRRRHRVWNKKSFRVGFTLVAVCLFLAGSISFFVLWKRSSHASIEQQPQLQAECKQCSEKHMYKHAAVAADAAICSTVGKDILQQGGSAVDAAIATLLCDGVANAHSMGVGGGFVMTFYKSSEKRAYSLIAREVAPAAASKNMFRNASSTYGGLAVAVPGEIRGYSEAHKRFGRLPWHKLFEPTIKICKDGFPVASALAAAIKGAEKEIRADAELSRVFVNGATKKLLQAGDTCKRLKLAKTLQLIADKGGQSFYTGKLAADVVQDVVGRGGLMTEADLRSYRAAWLEPVTFRLRGGLQLHTAPAPVSGSVLAAILNILDGYKFSARDDAVNSRVLTDHRIVEAFKFAYAKRSALGDPDFVNVTLLLRNLTDRAWGDHIRSRITNHTHRTAYYDPTFQVPVDHGTAHISIMGVSGDAVAVTSTINTHFGSKVLGKRTGVIFNNQMDDFSTPNKTNSFELPASPSNIIRPGKRPFSSMAPAVITDKSGKVRLVVGASGGTRITTAVALVIVRHLWLRQGIDTAVKRARFHHQLVPTQLQLEPAFSQDLARQLHKLGHNISLYSNSSSVVQAISAPGDGFLHAVSDWRKGGQSDGY